jgi:hypothetical protein
MSKHPEVKVGDKLIYEKRLLIVEKVTATGIIKCGNGISFRPDLYRRGAVYCGKAELATLELVMQIEHEKKAQRARNVMYSIRWHDVPDDVVIGTACAYGLLMADHSKKSEAKDGGF